MVPAPRVRAAGCSLLRTFARYEDVRAELESSEIAFFTANQIALLPDDAVDAFVNISSLHEMRPAQIDHYLLQMARTSRQMMIQLRSFTNTDDNTIVTRESYRLPAPWRWTRRPDTVQDPLRTRGQTPLKAGSDAPQTSRRFSGASITRRTRSASLG